MIPGESGAASALYGVGIETAGVKARKSSMCASAVTFGIRLCVFQTVGTGQAKSTRRSVKTTTRDAEHVYKERTQCELLCGVESNAVSVMVGVATLGGPSRLLPLPERY